MEKFFKYYWVILWGVFSIIFLVFAATEAQNEKALAYLAMCIACQARCEIKILQNRLEELKDEKGLPSKKIDYDD